VGDLGTILRFDGVAWAKMTSGTTRPLRGVWGRSGAIYAVGDQGTILRNSGASWIAETTPNKYDLYAVSGAGSDVLAVGYHGQIFQRAASGSWTQATWGGTTWMLGVCSVGGSAAVYATGLLGTLLKGC
jgi:hypothetical protein